MKLSDLFSNPFVWGLALGLLFFGLSLYAHLKTKLSLGRYKKLLSDKLEIEADWESGELTTFKDIYDRDAPVLASLDQPRKANRTNVSDDEIIVIEDDPRAIG